jgi:hypothetical protein
MRDNTASARLLAKVLPRPANDPGCIASAVGEETLAAGSVTANGEALGVDIETGGKGIFWGEDESIFNGI